MSQFLTHSAAFMNDLAATPVWSSLGWTMWHYLWIGLIELACGILLLAMIPRFYSALRYRFLLVLFALLLITPIGIFQFVWNEASRIDNSLTSEATVPPIWTTAPVMVRAPAQEFIEPDRMPNALQPPWKPDSSAEIPDRSLPQVAITYPQSPPQTASKSNAFGPLFFERLATYIPWLPLIWMIGSPLTLLFLGLGLIGAERYRRQARIISSGHIVDQCTKLAARIGVRQKVLVAFSERVISPVLIGILKPLILLPITAETGWTPAQLEIVLLHELAHVRRWDNLVNLIQRLAEGILFFQPAVWIISRWLTLEREHCCDELVVRVTGRAQDYATALAELALAEHLPPGVVSSMARHPLLGRIRRILGHEQPLQVSRATLTFALIFSIGCCALASLTQSEEQPKATVETTSKEADKKPEPDSAPSNSQGWKFEDVNGKPIEGVEVSAFSGGRSYPPETWKTPELKDPKNLIGKFTSDAEGKVQVQTPDNKPFILEFKKPGFMTLLKFSESWKRWVEDQNRPEFIPIELMRAGTITVEIRGTDGLPASGVKLVCGNYFRSKSLKDSTKTTSAVTDENGRAVLNNLREGLVNLACTHTGSDQIKRTWSDCLLLADGAKLTVPIDLSQFNSSITGFVRDELDQAALPNTFVIIEREWDFDQATKDLDEATRHRILDGLPTNQVAFPRELLRLKRFPVERKLKGVQTDAEGKFDIGKIPAGNYHLTFFHERTIQGAVPYYGGSGFQATTVKIHERIAEKDVVLPANRMILLKVVSDGPPAEKEAQKEPVEPPPTSDPLEPKQSNLPPSSILGLDGGKAETLTPEEANPKNLQIGGQVLDDQGKPLVGAVVRAYIRGTAGREDREIARTETNSQGEYKIQWYRGEVGSVIVEVSRSGYLTDEREALEITRFPDAIDSTFRMVKGASVEVTVLGDDDKPLKDALVMLSTQHRSRYYMEMTDEEGKFKLTDLVPGEASLTYPPLGYGGSNEEILLTSVARTLTDEALKKKFPGRFRGLDHHVPIENVVYLGEFNLVAGETASTTIRLSECSSQLHGRVVDQNGQPLKGVQLSLGRISKDVPMDRIPEVNGVLKASRRLWTDDEGRYRIDRINPGRYEIQTSHDLGRNLQGKRHTFVIGEKEDRVETLVMTSKNRQSSQPIPPTPIATDPEIPPGKERPHKATPAPSSPPSPPPASIERKQNIKFHVEHDDLTPIRKVVIQRYQKRDGSKVVAERREFEVNRDGTFEWNLEKGLGVVDFDLIANGTETSLTIAADAWDEKEVFSIALGKPRIKGVQDVAASDFERMKLRYDGKPFHEWVQVLRTEIKTERIVEAIEVMLYFGSKGYQSEAASEVVASLRRISPVQEIRERTSSALILSKAIITLNLLGKDSVPSLVEMLRDQDDSQVILGLEFLSRFSTEPWDWPDKLPEPTSSWQVVPPSLGENQELLIRYPPWWFSPEIGKELARLLKHPNPEIRARLMPVALRCHTGEELPEVLNESLTDLAPAVWFNSLVFLETYKSLFQVSPNNLRDIFRKLKEEGKFKGDPIRRNLYLRSILSDLSNNPPEETIQYIPDILDDLKATPIYEETAYWHLMSSAVSVSPEKAQSLQDAVRKAAAELPPDQKTRVEETLKALDPEIERGIKEAEDLKTP